MRQNTRDHLQNGVANRMSILVVDTFKVVNIEHDQPERLLLSPRSGHHKLHHLHGVSAIRQAGQRVGGGQSTQRSISIPNFGNHVVEVDVQRLELIVLDRIHTHRVILCLRYFTNHFDDAKDGCSEYSL